MYSEQVESQPNISNDEIMMSMLLAASLLSQTGGNRKECEEKVERFLHLYRL